MLDDLLQAAPMEKEEECWEWRSKGRSSSGEMERYALTYPNTSACSIQNKVKDNRHTSGGIQETLHEDSNALAVLEVSEHAGMWSGVRWNGWGIRVKSPYEAGF